MSTFKITFQAYKSDIFLKISTIVFLVIAFLWQSFCLGWYLKMNFHQTVKEYPTFISEGFIFAAMVSFFFFLISSYYFFNFNNRFMFSELLPVAKKSVLFLNQAAVSALIAFLYIFMFALMHITAILYSRHFEGEYILYVIKLYALDGLLNSILAILIGGALALNKNKIKVLFLILLIAALTLPYNEYIVFLYRRFAYDTPFDTPLIYWLNYYCNIFYNPLHREGFHIYSYRFQLFFAWICLFLSIILKGYFNLNKAFYKTAFKAMALGSLGFFVWFSLPASRVVDCNGDIKNEPGDYNYYYEKLDLKEEAAAFKVTDYDIKFKIKRNLSAKATLTLDKNELSEYKFTLYHGYKVRKITDESGEKLKFTQQDDYVTVYPERALNKMTMFYSGKSTTFQSNSEATHLPGDFPFFPQSGYKIVYNMQKQQNNHLTLEEKANFHIKINTPKKAFTNLDEIAPNEFSGCSESLCIVTGYYKQRDINGVGYVYYYLNAQDENYFNEIENDISENIKNGFFPPDLKKIIMKRSSGGEESFCVYSDYVNAVIIDAEQLKEDAYIKEIGPKKYRVYMWLNMYNKEPEFYYQTLEAYRKENFEFGGMDLYLFNECKNKYGTEFMNEKCYEYMNNKDDERDSAQFLNDLLENGV